MRATLALLGLLLTAQTALAGPLPAPQLHPGRFVYTIPGDFDPPLIGRDGLEEIQAVLSNLRFPYYVVIVDRLHGGTDEHAAEAVDGLAEDWQRQSGFDASTSSIFLLAYGPERKYRFLAGARWKSELGFEREAHRPYTQIFERAVKGTPKDPQGGIIRMATAVNEYLFDQTDPGRIALRKAQDEQRARQRQKQEARKALGEQIGRMEGLLKKRDYLPADVSKEQAALDHAHKIWDQDDTVAIINEATAFKLIVDEFEEAVTSAKDAAYWATLARVSFWVAICALILIIILLIKRRADKQAQLNYTFSDQLQDWVQKIQRASGRYVDFFGERDDILLLHEQAKGETEGEAKNETAALLKRVTDKVNAIFIDVQAMAAHIDRIAEQARTSTFFNLQPLRDAIAALNEPFDFDTGVLNPDDLFGTETKTVRVSPTELQKDLQQRFAEAMDGWKELKLASEIQHTIAEDHFKQDALDALFAQADADGIPRRWLRSHPLFGDDEADKAFYEGLNALRLSDPLAFRRKIVGFMEVETEIGETLDELHDALARLAEVRREHFEDLGVIIGSDDDPNLSLEQARAAEAVFATFLHTGEDVHELYKLIDPATTLYAQAIRQDLEIREAISRLDGALKSADEGLIFVEERFRKAQERHDLAVTIHSKVESDRLIRAGYAKIVDAQQAIRQARDLKQNARLLDALRKAKQADVCERDAIKLFEQAIEHCNSLDRKKSDFERELQRMADLRSDAARKIADYGGNSSVISGYSAPTLNGPMDYAMLSLAIESQQREWEDKVRRAKREHEAREAERRRREEQARREEENRRAAARRAAESSRRSSSGSSWSSGRSSSSGGSFGGGRSSSSGGSW